MSTKRWQELGRAFEKNAEELDRLYHSLDSELELDQVSASWQFLVEHGLVVGNPSLGYTPSPSLLQLGDTLSLVENRQTQVPDIAEWLKNLEYLIQRYHIAKSEQDETDYILTKREIHTSILYMQSHLDGEISQIEYYLDNKFGHVNSLKAKQKENEYCIQRASRYSEKLTIITVPEINRLCGNDAELMGFFYRKLFPSVRNCRERLLAAIPRLKHILWEYRRTNQRTRLVRAMNNYLQAGRGFSGDGLTEQHLKETPFNVIAAEPMAGHADVLIEKDRQDLIKIVESMRSSKYETVLHEEAEESVLIERDEIREAEIPAPVLEPFLIAFIKSLKEGEQSARKFWSTQKSEIVSPGIWIWWLHQELRKLNRTEMVVTPIKEIVPVYSANHIVTDLLVRHDGEK